MQKAPNLVQLNINSLAPAKKLEAVFFRTARGTEPVRELWKKLQQEDKKLLGDDIKVVQFAWPVGMPLVDSLGHGLWEIRSKLTRGRIIRTIFFMNKSTMVLVNSFIKKTQKTPKAEIVLSLKRKKQYESQ